MEPGALESERLETPERVDLFVDLAGVGSRGLAQLVDLFLLSVASAALLLLFVFLVPALGTWSAVLAFAGIFLLYWLYFIVFETVWQGQTPGKRLLHLRVQKVGGYPIDWTEALVRNLLRPIDAFLGYGLGVLTMLLSSRCQRIGDLAAGTVVVRESSAGLDELERIGYATAEGGRAGASLLEARQFEVLHDFLSRRGQLDPAAARRIESRLARSLRDALAREGRLAAEWRTLGDEAFLVRLDAACRGEGR